MNPSSKTFCVLPFVSMSNTNSGEYRICCDSFGFGPNIQTDSADTVWNSDYYKKIRLDLIDGVENPNCESCWRVEKNGGYSMRQNESRKYSAEEIIKHVESNGTVTILPEIFDLKLGNLCNLKCIMCCQLSSSQHETEIRLWKSTDIKLPSLLEYIEVKFKDEAQQYRLDKDNLDAIMSNLDPVLKTIDHVRLVGGEPLINPLTKLVIKRLPKTANIEIITNLTEVDHELLEDLKRYQSAKLTCSIDHVDAEKFEYIRFPADYNTCMKNFEILTHKEISLTVSIFNVFDLKEIFDHFEQYSPITVSFNWVLDPEYFCIKYLEHEQKQQISAQVKQLLLQPYNLFKNNNNLVSYLENIDNVLIDTSNFDSVVKERTRVLRLYDTTRGTDYRTLFPYIKDYD